MKTLISSAFTKLGSDALVCDDGNGDGPCSRPIRRSFERPIDEP
jgi:hypothetical protein